MLYTGEHFDTDSQNYYLRARWYDSLSGRFNRMDPFAGSPQDPQSLHKYLYAHCNPINGIDPSGKFTVTEMMVTLGILSLIVGILLPVVHSARERMSDQLKAIEQADAVSFLGPGLQQQMQRDMTETTDPDALGMNVAFWHELGGMNKSVTYQRHFAEKKLLDAVDTSFHAIQYSALAAGIIVPIGNSMSATKIVWSKPHGSAAHWQTITDNVTRRSVAGHSQKIYTNRALSTITGHRTKSLMRPDWAEVSLSGKIRVYEVVSPNQRYKDFIEKGNQYKRVLGEMLEEYKIINIGEHVP